jgi:hypothetical protein
MSWLREHLPAVHLADQFGVAEVDVVPVEQLLGHLEDGAPGARGCAGEVRVRRRAGGPLHGQAGFGQHPLALGLRHVVAELDEDVLGVDDRGAELVAQAAPGELDLGVLVEHHRELRRVADRRRVDADARLGKAEQRRQPVLRDAAR